MKAGTAVRNSWHFGKNPPTVSIVFFGANRGNPVNPNCIEGWKTASFEVCEILCRSADIPTATCGVRRQYHRLLEGRVVPFDKEAGSYMNLDKAGKAYWDHNWENREIPTAIDPCERTLDNYANRKFHECFRKAFSYVGTSDQKLLEIGCAGSAWLPYFAKEFGFEVYGIDYSELGCQQAAQVLENRVWKVRSCARISFLRPSA